MHEVASLAWGLGSAYVPRRSPEKVRTLIRDYVLSLKLLPSADQRALAMLARGLLKLDLPDAFVSLLDMALAVRMDFLPVPRFNIDMST